MATHGELWAVELEACGLTSTDIGDPEAPPPPPHARASPRVPAQIQPTPASKDSINADLTTRQLPSPLPADIEDTRQPQETASKERALPARPGVEVPFPLHSETQRRQQQPYASSCWPVRVSAAHPLCARLQAIEATYPLPSIPGPSMHASSTERPTSSHSSGTSNAVVNSTDIHVNHAHIGEPLECHSGGPPFSEGGLAPPQFLSLGCQSATADLWPGFCSYSKSSAAPGCSSVEAADGDASHQVSGEAVKNEDDWWLWQAADKDGQSPLGRVQSAVDHRTNQTRPSNARSADTCESRGAPPRGEGMVTQFDSSDRWPSHQVPPPNGMYARLDSVVIHSSGAGGEAACKEEMHVMPPVPLEALPQRLPLDGSQLHGGYTDVIDRENTLSLCGGQMNCDGASFYASSTTSCCSSSPYTSPSSPSASADNEEPSCLHLSREDLVPSRLNGKEGTSWHHQQQQQHQEQPKQQQQQQQQQQFSCMNPATPEVGQEEDYGPWCSAAVVASPSESPAGTLRHPPGPPRRRSRSRSSSSSNSSTGGEDTCVSGGLWRTSLNQSTPRFPGRSFPLSFSRRPLRNLSNKSTKRVGGYQGGHVRIQFDEDNGVDGGFLSIHRSQGKPGARTPRTRKSPQVSFGSGRKSVVSRVDSSMAKMYDRLQQQLEKQEGAVEGVRTPELKLEVEELRKRRLAEPMRQRLLRQYTEHLRRLDAAKAEAFMAEERSDKIRPLLVKVVMAASKLRSLQSSESWREYVGAAVTDVDADLSIFVNNFGEDLTTVEGENEVSSSRAAAGRGICAGFWKRRSVAGAFLALMLLYLVVIAGVVFWLQHTGSTNSAPAPAITRQQRLL
ncbi:hypothetical protein ACSSS7_003447 [Eimeria intestinalis]